MLRPENRREPRPRMRGDAIDDVNELMIDRGGVTDDADALTIETGRREQSFGSQRDSHAELSPMP